MARHAMRSPVRRFAGTHLIGCYLNSPEHCTFDLFAPAPHAPRALAAGASVLPEFALGQAAQLVAAVDCIAAQSPFRQMVTRGGFRMSVAMTNCGALGWTSDRRGYRYAPVDVLTAAPWPAMPHVFLELAGAAAHAGGFHDFVPDACLINRYVAGARMSLHQDQDERDFSAPIVSVSLGLSAVFLFGGDARSDKSQRVPLQHGDVVVWGGEARLRYHGVLPLKPGCHALTGEHRINLTFRCAGR
jgi:alkylated DNA repair protein (DNA oxidative demethylase)